jgi:hypothetical protein
MSSDDPKGVADRPDTAPMQGMADALHRLAVGEHPAEFVRATAKAAANIMELQTDWLMDQHKLIATQHEAIVTLNGSVQELAELVRRLLPLAPK